MKENAGLRSKTEERGVGRRLRQTAHGLIMVSSNDTFGHIGNEPADTLGRLPQPVLVSMDSSLRNVDHSDV